MSETTSAAGPARVGVVGAGAMGAGIAHAFLRVGDDVVLVDTLPAALAAATARVRRYLDRGQTPAAATGRLTTAATMASLQGCVLVVEAVPESVDLKRRVLADIGEQAPGALLASNTSSIAIDELAAGQPAAHRFAGLHFFNPVPASDLVEIVRGSATDDDTVRLLTATVARLGKTSVVVRDSPGFASSRLGVALALEAMRMVEQGVASAADIDLAMTLGYRHATGPLATSDLVGLDVRLRIAEYLASTLGERFEPPEILRDLVARGDLGKKTGRGFHEWQEA